MTETCNICCYDRVKYFNCKNIECTMKKCCIECMKRYLLNSSSEPHCMSCRIQITNTDFIHQFPKNWRLSTYKEHKKEILFSKEMSRLNEALDEIDRKKQIKEKTNKVKELKELIEQYNIEIQHLNNGTMKVKNEYKYKCPTIECNGYLNNNYKCQLCEKNFCKDCFEDISNELEKDHNCNEDLKATISKIKKEAKPCPKCGTMIMKRSGCDQLFCTNKDCGTAFSWKTGVIDMGVIHNPEAYGFYEKFPDAKEAYLNRIRNRNQDNNENCLINQWDLANKLRSLGIHHLNEVILINRNLYNFKNYRPIPINNDNMDLRIKYLNKTLTEESMKKTLHMRNKRFEKEKNDYDIINTCADVINDLFKLILDSNEKSRCNDILYKEIPSIIEYTNDNLKNNSDYFELKSVELDNVFHMY